MPNIPQQQTIVQYIANAAQTTYTFAFYAPLSTDIQVYYQSSTAVPIPASDILILNTQYTVTYNSDPLTGGFITLLFTPTTGFYLTINRQVAASLNTNFSNAQNFNGANLDAALDRLLLLCQQNQNYNLQRNLSYIINTYLPNATPYTQLPPLPQNFVWIGSASGVVAAEISTVPSASVLQSMLANNSPGTAGSNLIGYYDTPAALSTTVDVFLSSNCIGVKDNSVVQNTINVTAATNYRFLNGNRLAVVIAISNNGATTIVINGTSGRSVVKYNSVGALIQLQGGELSNGGSYEFLYDLANNVFILVNPNPSVEFYGASVYATGNQVIANTVKAAILFNTVDYDANGIFVFANNWFLITRPGYYQVVALIQAVPVVNTGAVGLQLYKNGSLWVPLDEIPLTTGTIVSGTFTLFLNAGDTVALLFQNSTGGNVTLVSGGFFNNFQITYMGN